MGDPVLKKLQEHDEKFEMVFTKFHEHDGRFDRLGKDMTEVKEDVAVLKDDVHKLGIKNDEFSQKLDQVLDIVQLILERNVSDTYINKRFSEHDHRISALEYTVRPK